MFRKITVSLFCCLWILPAIAQEELPLYPGAIPNSTNAKNAETSKNNGEVGMLAYKVSRPTLTVFQPPAGQANGMAVIICPGGGYGVLLMNREGADVAKAFNKQGITAFVLKYRLPDKQFQEDPSIGPLQDAQQAIKTVRQNAGKWQVDTGKIGIMGFSAGGHLASTAGTHFDKALISNKENISLRPDFMILVYPVISFSKGIGHIGSRNNLLATTTPTPAQINFFSNELHVNSQTPPTFLVHATDDIVVPVENSVNFYLQLKTNKVPATMHIYNKGGHGFLKTPSFEEWFGRCIYWMQQSGWMK
ncbi:alpha/beta hydrolase [Chitinophaga sp. MM2321]|uniref:alpha/beta hydrolase n=1 Tax=Chitinophaga sp. MM2321 TaxID=3137178 RepID=UPI0032D57245